MQKTLSGGNSTPSSVAVGIVKYNCFPFGTSASNGPMSSTGSKVGIPPVAFGLITVTEKAVPPWFPAASDAVHETIVMPIGNRLPDEGSHVGPVVTPMLSDT